MAKQTAQTAEKAESGMRNHRCKKPCRYLNQAWREGDILTLPEGETAPSYFEPAK